jgi:hypothetical protein
MRALAFLIVLTAAHTAVGDTTSRFYPYDDTAPVTHKLSGIKDGLEFRIVKPSIVADVVCGAYQDQYGMLGGFTLHVFPDKTAMIVEAWDVDPQPSVVAEGTWSISEAGEVAFDWKAFTTSIKELEFKKSFGECRKMKAFICFRGKIPTSFVLVSEEKVVARIEQAYWRVAEYIDWQELKSEFKKPKLDRP